MKDATAPIEERATGTSASVDPHVSRSIDVIRGAAALGVIWGHSVYGIPRMEFHLGRTAVSLELNGGVWVWIFLTISGYLVGKGFCDGGYGLTFRGYGRFLFNRALRILPLAYLALVISVVGFLAAGQALPDQTVSQLFFVPRNNDMSLVNGFWSIAAELQFYLAAGLVIPVVVYAHRFAGAWGGMVVFGAAIYASAFWVLHTGDNAYQPRSFIGNLPFFVCGLVISQVPNFRFPAARVVKVASVAGLLFVVWWLQNYRAPYFWGWGDHKWPLGGAMVTGMAIAASALLFRPPAGAGNGLVARRALQPILGVLQWCGFFCYGIYVWHGVLGKLNALFWDVPPGFGRLQYLLLSIPLAYLSYHLVEKPCMRFRFSHRERP